MSNFKPGKIVKEFSVEGEGYIIRYPKWTDLESILDYINKLSQEKTYIAFCGEEISRKEETEYLASLFKRSELGEGINLFVFHDQKMVGSAYVKRDKSAQKRKLHVGVFGISIAKEYRGRGLGEILTRTIINEVNQVMANLKLITLQVYELNEIGLNLYRKIGFALAGTIPKSVLHKDQYIDEHQMYLKLDED